MSRLGLHEDSTTPECGTKTPGCQTWPNGERHLHDPLPGQGEIPDPAHSEAPSNLLMDMFAMVPEQVLLTAAASVALAVALWLLVCGWRLVRTLVVR